MERKIEGLGNFGGTAQTFQLAACLRRSSEARQALRKAIDDLDRPERYTNEDCDRVGRLGAELAEMIRAEVTFRNEAEVKAGWRSAA